LERRARFSSSVVTVEAGACIDLPPPTDLERSGALEDSGRRGFAAQGRGRSRGGPGGAGWRRRRELGGGAVGSSGAEPGGPGWVMFFVVLVISVTDELKFSYF
jgi:hypothetical protein